MADTLWTLLIGLFSGFVGWLLTEFVAKPFRRGVDLVSEVKTSTLLHANVRARATEQSDGTFRLAGLTDFEDARLRDAESEFRLLGVKLIAFATTEPISTLLLKVLGRDLATAGAAMIGLANTFGMYGAERHSNSEKVELALGFTTKPTS